MTAIGAAAPEADRSRQQSGLWIDAVDKSFGATAVLKGVSLRVPSGQFHTLLGPSGSGKTTLLKIIAGFTPADAGSVTLAGARITDTPPEHRNIGVVFQNYALFPHMTVAQNVGFGLRMRRVGRAEREGRVAEALRLVRMTGFEQRRPAALSGGQQQRVALARALVIRPQLLLLDEPLSALDRKVRGEVREELKRIQAETGVTTVMVTHDQEEAMVLADRVLVLEAGAVRQEGSPAEIYCDPADEFVAGFLGPVDVLTVDVRRQGAATVLRLGNQEFSPPAGVAAATATAAPGGPVQLAVRPEQWIVTPAGNAARPSDAVAGRLVAVEFGGAVATVRVELEGRVVTALALSPDVLGPPPWRPDMAVWLRLRQARVMPRAGASG